MTSVPPRPTPIFDPRPSLDALLSNPAVRRSLKAVLLDWAGRDPVDAAEDANLLALAFERRADERCERRSGLDVLRTPSEPRED